jgi:hypothetical protein
MRGELDKSLRSERSAQSLPRRVVCYFCYVPCGSLV